MLFEVCTCMRLHAFAKTLSCLFVRGRGSAQKERRRKRMEEADGEAKQKGADLEEVHKMRSEVLQPLTLFV